MAAGIPATSPAQLRLPWWQRRATERVVYLGSGGDPPMCGDKMRLFILMWLALHPWVWLVPGVAGVAFILWMVVK